ncbi:ABC transporter permease [Arthrobacter sp. zg-Y820]|uniref:ABC transporter permease n=1 Tax=unclassified Arthrobacter TaxID=235627 RepID=UPI001E4CBACE|nr:MULTISPECIES: ABC transporter permease [unclassified Arthrobacter]MCC9195525.1 ABC transporter permease [Arthrobacter sp. zg-Y820]MDK1278384.1 ABC transporter permease [Arthrobacter sp. zg.Y820]MDK1360073.1 ABC transporter permease [Arthrobacter sp. zg-Y1219]WIB10257.1 ABC transporter permease [Arthrobacter sp. zg-Y820]
MSTATIPASAGRHAAAQAIRSWKIPIILGALAILGFILFGLGSPSAEVTFRLTEENAAIQLPNIVVSAPVLGWISSVVLLASAAWSAVLVSRFQHVPVWLIAMFAVFFIAAFLTWSVGSARSPSVAVYGLLAGSFTLAFPLIFGALSGVLCERSGVVNIAIEGQLLFGAFAAAVAGTLSGNAFVGLFAAAVAGVLVSLVLAVFSIKYIVNQVIVGVVLNVLVSGLTGFLFSTVLSTDPAKWNSPPRLPSIRIPFLADIPIIGPILFDQSVIGYLMYIAVAGIYFGLFHTRWGLRTRAVGEHPKAADTLGVNVNRMRFLNVLAAGAVAGVGGAFFTLVSVSSFNRDMTSGQGYIALAALILGRWNPIGALFAALLFGFASNLQSVLSLLGTPVPNQFLAMLPYLVTIFVVAGVVGKSRGPAASGIPYIKG